MYQAWPWPTPAQPGDASYVHPTTATVATVNTPQVAGQWSPYGQYGVPNMQQQWTAWAAQSQYNYAAAMAAGAQIRTPYPQVALTGAFADTSQAYQTANTIAYQNTTAVVEAGNYESSQSNPVDSKSESTTVNKVESGMEGSKIDRGGLKEVKDQSKKELEPKDDAESEKLNQLRAQAQQWKSQQQQQTPTWNFNAISQSTTAVTSAVVTQVTSTAPTSASTQNQWGSGSWQSGSWDQSQYTQQWPRTWDQQESQTWKSENSQEKDLSQEKLSSMKTSNSHPAEKSNDNLQEQQTDNDREFEEFERQFSEWEKQFESWKEQNINHPDKKAFTDYEKQWQEWRNQLLQRRQQLQLSKASRSEKLDNSTEKHSETEQKVGKNDFFDKVQSEAFSSTAQNASNFMEKEQEPAVQKIPGLDHLQDESSVTSDVVPLPNSASLALEPHSQGASTNDQNLYFPSQLPLTNAPPPPPPPQVMYMAPQQPFFYQPGLPPPPPPMMTPFQIPRHPPPPISSNLQKDFNESSKTLLPSPTGFKMNQDPKRPLLSTPPQTFHPGASRGSSSGLLPLPPPESRINAGPPNTSLSPGVNAANQEMMPEAPDVTIPHIVDDRYDYGPMYKDLPEENDPRYFNEMEDISNDVNVCEGSDQFQSNIEVDQGSFRDWNIGPERGRGRNRGADRMRGRGRGRVGRESRWSDDFHTDTRPYGNPPDEIFSRGEVRNRGGYRGSSGLENRSTPEWEIPKNPNQGPPGRSNLIPSQNFKPEIEKGPPFGHDSFGHSNVERYGLPAPIHDTEFPSGSATEENFPLDLEHNNGFQPSKRAQNFHPRHFQNDSFHGDPRGEGFQPGSPFNVRKGHPPNFINIEQFPENIHFPDYPPEKQRMPDVLDNERFGSSLTDETVPAFRPPENERLFHGSFNRNESFPPHFDEGGRFPPPMNEEGSFLPVSYPEKYPKEMERRHPLPFFPRDRFNPGHIPEGNLHRIMDNPDLDTFRPDGDFPPHPPFGRNFPYRPPFDEERFPENSERFCFRNSERFARESEFSRGRYRDEEFGCSNVPPNEIMHRPDIPPCDDVPYHPDEMRGRKYPYNPDPQFRYVFPDEGFPRHFPVERDQGFFNEPGFGPPVRKPPLLDHGNMERFGPPPGGIPFNTIDYTHRPAAAVLGDEFNKCEPYDFFYGNEPPNFRAPAVFDYAHRRDRSPHPRERHFNRERDMERNRDPERMREPFRDRDRIRDRERDKERERTRDRERERDSDRDRERDRERKDRDRERNRDRDRDGHRERESKREWDRDRERTKDREDNDKENKRFAWDRSVENEKNYTKDKSGDLSSYKQNEDRNIENNSSTLDSKGSGQLGSQSSTFKSDVKSETVMIDDLLCSPGRLSRPKQLVIILRGLPGSGKTYVAKLIKDKEIENGGSAPRILSLDDYFMVETEVTDVDPETGKRMKRKEFQFEYENDMEEAYRSSLYKCFKKTIDDRFFPFIIIDAIHDKAKHFEQFWSYAKQRGFQVYVAEMDCKDSVICFKRNVHKRKQEDISKILSQWEAKPRHFMSVDVRSLLQDGAITEVEMEDSVASEKKDVDEENKDDDMEDSDALTHFHVPSRWEQFETTEEKLDQLDGLRISKKKHSSIKDYLQLPDDYEERECEPGKKRVRWADLEERKEQDRLRAIGFVVGQTDWTKMTDPTHAERALTRTKYI